jgi:hypothetical protein
VVAALLTATAEPELVRATRGFRAGACDGDRKRQEEE